MSYLDWHVGMKVVCVDDAPRIGPSWDTCSHPEKGRIYTIRGISHWALWTNAKAGVGVWLAEIERELVQGVEHPFGASRFRPLVQRKTDISLFTAMLNPSKQRVDA